MKIILNLFDNIISIKEQIMQIKSYKKKYFHISSTPLDNLYNTNKNTSSRVIYYKNNTVRYNPQGLWISCGTEWIDLLIRTGISNIQFMNVNYVYEVKLNKNVLKINNIKQFNNLLQKYKNPKSKTIKDDLDWKKIKKEYDGLVICPFLQNSFYHFTVRNSEIYKNSKEFINKLPKLRAEWYQSWDIASGVIWRMTGIKKLVLVNGISKEINKPSFLQQIFKYL